MAKDAVCQIRMDSDLKEQVEALYRGMGTSFAEAVRIFARQSVREGRLPFRPGFRVWEEITPEEMDTLVRENRKDLAEGKFYTQEEMDADLEEWYAAGIDQTI